MDQDEHDGVFNYPGVYVADGSGCRARWGLTMPGFPSYSETRYPRRPQIELVTPLRRLHLSQEPIQMPGEPAFLSCQSPTMR